MTGADAVGTGFKAVKENASFDHVAKKLVQPRSLVMRGGWGLGKAGGKRHSSNHVEWKHFAVPKRPQSFRIGPKLDKTPK